MIIKNSQIAWRTTFNIKIEREKERDLRISIFFVSYLVIVVTVCPNMFTRLIFLGLTPSFINDLVGSRMT